MQRHAGNATSPTAGQVVLHADDFGCNRAVTDGVLHGFRRGLLTSTSLLANAPDADRALDEWHRLLDEQRRGSLPSADVRRRLGDPAAAFDLGIHLNLTQGRPLSGASYPAELLDAAGRFCGVWTLFRRLRRPRPGWFAAVQNELARQIERIVDRGLQPTHLNGHQYVEMLPAVAPLLPELLARYAIPVVRVAAERALFRSTALRSLAVPQWLLSHVKGYYARRFGRNMDARGIAHPDVFFGTAHAGRIDLRLMRLFLRSAPIPGSAGVPPACEDAAIPGSAGILPAGRNAAVPAAICGRDARDPREYPTIEIGLHPAVAPTVAPLRDADGWRDPLAACRPKELQLLLSADLADAILSLGLRLGRLSTLAAIAPVSRPFQAGNDGLERPVYIHARSLLLHSTCRREET